MRIASKRSLAMTEDRGGGGVGCVGVCGGGGNNVKKSQNKALVLNMC